MPKKHLVMITNNKQWYEQLFENSSNQYENENFTKGTKGEVDFLEQEFGFNKNAKILDVGCGTGRHSIELAKRGYKPEGFDLSENQLAKARENAAKANVEIKFFQADARTLNFKEKYDYAIMMCEGSFPLMETDEMNFEILSNLYKSVKPGGKIIFTTLNGLFPLFHSVKDFINDNSFCQSSNNTFDLMTFRDYSNYTFKDDGGVEHTLSCNERYYVPSEITWMLKSLGFKNVNIYGAPLGEFSRSHALTTEDYEMLVIAEK